MRALGLTCAALSLWGGVAVAQQGSPLPVPAETNKRTTSTPDLYERETAFKKKFEDESSRRRELEAELEKIRTNLTIPSVTTPSDTSGAEKATKKTRGSGVEGGDGLAAVPVRRPRPKGSKGTSKNTKAIMSTETIMNTVSGAPEPWAGELPLVFTISAAASEEAGRSIETAVPLGSYVKARVLTGVEANTLEAYPVLLQLDYAFVGPNHTRIDMSHCFMIAKAKANLSTERVLGETQQLSCVREDNEVITRPAKGYLAGEDSTFGITGELISNQGRVLLTAVLASLAKGAGEAVSMAQTSTEVASGLGGTATATNVTGSKLAYIAGKSVVEPATTIANWYLDYAKQLVPSIAVGSGRDIWIVLLDTVLVPPLSGNGGTE